MATYFVDFVNGLDANNGLGPDASHATNRPWKTLTKLLGAAGMASGDTAYLSPAGPFRETVAVAMTSATAETSIIGDPENQQGFKTSGGVAVAPGPVILTAYTTNDKTAPTATILLDLAGRDFLTFRNMLIVGGSGIAVSAITNTSTNIKFLDCAFLANGAGSAACINVTSAFGVALNWLIDRCLIVGVKPQNGSGIVVTMATGSGADWDANVVVQNSEAWGFNTFLQAAGSGASANKGGGVGMRNCTVMAGGRGMYASNATVSTTVPCWAYNNFLMCPTGLQANAAGQIVENYNLINAGTPLTNVTQGANTIIDGSYAPLFHFGQERIFKQAVRQFGEPMAGSPLLGFGNDGSQTAYDLRNLLRPAGGVSALAAAGAMERGNTFAKETGTVRTGSNAISVTGPGYQEFLVPVDASSTTISVYVRWDATYAGTKPQLVLDANGEIGVSAETKTATGSSGSWEQLTLSAFTPTAKGVVKVRVISNDTNGGGNAFADDFAVA